MNSRNVVSIDLANHPNANKWPEHQCHNYATQWILHTLERGRPYRTTDWPSHKKRPDLPIPPIPDELQPVGEITTDLPLEEPWPPSGNRHATVDEVVSIWAHNRKLYPGWLAVPVSVQRNMSAVTEVWEPIILNELSKLAPVRQLQMVHELTWRREILLDPISSELEAAAQKAIQQIDCQARTVNGESRKDIEWSDVRAN